MRRILTSVAALLLVVTIVLGIPVFLIVVAGNPLPDWTQLAYPDYGGRFLLETVLPVLVWAAWAFFTVPFLLAIPTAVQDARTDDRARTTGVSAAPLRVQRAAAAAVVTAVLVLLGSNAQAAVAATETPATPAHVVAGTADASASPASPSGSGHTLQTPADAAPPSPEVQYKERVIVTGDTLWDIAEEELGDGFRYPEIFDASTGIRQPGGAHLNDADLIYPGWTIRIPTATQAPRPPVHAPPAPADAPPPPTADNAPDDASASTTDLSESARTPKASPSPSTSTDAEEGGIDAPSGQDDVEETVGMIAGISAALAAGVLAAVAVLRLRQRRRRKSGERLVMPTGETADLETALRAVEDAPGAEDLDRALRYLGAWAVATGSPVPDLYAARIDTSGIGLFLAAPATLPAPFHPTTGDEMVWALPAGATLDDVGADAVNPYPALLQLGVDQAGACVLIDVESRGILHLTGAEDIVAGVAAAMVLELATSRWTDQATITLIGQPRGLPRLLGPRRIRHVEHAGDVLVPLRARVRETTRLLGEAGAESVSQARARRTAEFWAPEILILTTPTPGDPAVLAEMMDLARDAGRTGIVLITTAPVPAGSPELRVHATDRATLLPDGLELQPQHVDEHTLTLLHDLVRTAATPPRPRADTSSPPGTSDLDSADHDADRVGLVSDSSGSVAESDEPGRTDEDRTPDWAETAADADSPPAGAPYLRVLGPVGLDQTDDPDRPPAPGRGVELVAFLALHPHATTEAFGQAFWPASTGPAASASMRKLTNHTRNWLGAAPDGDLYLPRYEPAHGYRLHPAIRTDWNQFRDLVGDDPSKIDTERLVDALRLVRGQPFTGVNHRFWAWNSLDQEEMIALIGDVAGELFHRAYGAGDNARAGYAATIGNVVDPVNEVAWRNRMLAALAAGDMGRFERIVTDLQEFLDGFDDGYEPEPETQALIDDARRDLVPDA